MNDFQALIILNMVRGIGSIRVKRLMEAFERPSDIFNASPQELMEKGGLNPGLAQAVCAAPGKPECDPVVEMKRAEAAGARILSLLDPDYPELLRAIPDPPCVLYVKGDILACDENAVAIVGSRGASLYGLSCARTFSVRLSEYGLTIVSGMARGIDTAAHRAALDAGGRTIAVLGSGLNRIYPPENETLFQQIGLGGAVVSQFPMETPPLPQNFPMRNRLISGLSKGVLVVEASGKSGALITARCAAEQGRDVFAIPGELSNSNSGGVNGLIKDGARLVTDPVEILEGLRPLLNLSALACDSAKDEKAFWGEGDTEPDLLKYLDKEPRHIDSIARESGFSIPEILSLLTDLELKGVIRQTSGKSFSLVTPYDGSQRPLFH
ncbi:MAG: DNA-processing protein DprA [Candidatus Omnitrophota bacterium]